MFFLSNDVHFTVPFNENTDFNVLHILIHGQLLCDVNYLMCVLFSLNHSGAHNTNEENDIYKKNIS